MLEEAAAHPLKARALEIMVERPISARELSEEVGVPQEEATQLLNELRSAGLIAVEGKREGVSGSEDIYRGPYAPFYDKEEYLELDEDHRQQEMALVIRLLKADLDLAFEAGTLDAHPDFHLCRVPFHADEEGWQELRRIWDHALLESVRVQHEIRQRLKASGQEGSPGIVASLLFDLPESAADPKSANGRST